MRSLVIGAIVFAAMLLEARLAWRNERAQRARGGIEPSGDVYDLMRVAYPVAFAAMLVEGVLRGPAARLTLLVGALVFVAGKAIKYWAIATLGRCWTFRVIVVPGDRLVTSGPYRFVRHPNYIGVVGELVGLALMTGAPIAGTIGTIGFAAVLARRIRIEEGAILRASVARASVRAAGASRPSADGQPIAPD